MANITYYDPGTPIKCARGECKAIFHRPQDAAVALSTEAVAQLHGWRTIDREGEMLICPQHSATMG